MTGALSLLESNPNYYQFLQSFAERKNNKAIKQIDKDISRTFPGDPSFSRAQLRCVLVAYAHRNQNIGYCQGLNFIVATLLGLGFTEEESFWLFVQIIEHYLPTEYYNSMSGIILDQKIFDYLFRSKMQKVCKALEKIGIESGLFTVQWFICMFAFTFPREVVCFVWDHIFFCGYTVIFKIGLAAVWLLRKKILLQNDFVQTMNLIEQSCFELTDIKLLKSAMKKRAFNISPGLLKRLRSVLEKEVIKEFNDRFALVIPQEQLLQTLDRYCVDDNECKQKTLQTSSFFTFSASKVNEIEGYLDLCTYQKQMSCALPQPHSENYLIGKKNHCCRFEDEFTKQNSAFAPVELEELDEEDFEPIAFIRKNTVMASVKQSFAYISNFINIED